MKTLILNILIFFTFTINLLGQQDTIIIRDGWTKDTIERKTSVLDTLDLKDEMIIWNKEVNVTNTRNTTHPIMSYTHNGREIKIEYRGRRNRFNPHWAGFYFGFVNFANRDYSAYKGDKFMDLEWGSSFMMRFNFWDVGLPTNSLRTKGFVLGMGMDYMRLTFANDITIRRGSGGRIYPVDLEEEFNIKNPRRSTFKALYLTFPLLYEKQFPTHVTKKVHTSLGFVGGIRLHSKTKIVYNSEKYNKRKIKNSNNYSMIPIKVDVTAQMGYGSTCVWLSYSLTNMFNASKAPQLHPLTFGIGLAF